LQNNTFKSEFSLSSWPEWSRRAAPWAIGWWSNAPCEAESSKLRCGRRWRWTCLAAQTDKISTCTWDKHPNVSFRIKILNLHPGQSTIKSPRYDWKELSEKTHGYICKNETGNIKVKGEINHDNREKYVGKICSNA